MTCWSRSMKIHFCFRGHLAKPTFEGRNSEQKTNSKWKKQNQIVKSECLNKIWRIWLNVCFFFSKITWVVQRYLALWFSKRSDPSSNADDSSDVLRQRLQRAKLVCPSWGISKLDFAVGSQFDDGLEPWENHGKTLLTSPDVWWWSSFKLPWVGNVAYLSTHLNVCVCVGICPSKRSLLYKARRHVFSTSRFGWKCGMVVLTRKVMVNLFL